MAVPTRQGSVGRWRLCLPGECRAHSQSAAAMGQASLVLLLPCCTHCLAGVAGYLAWRCMLGSACSWQLCLISLLFDLELASHKPCILPSGGAGKELLMLSCPSLAPFCVVGNVCWSQRSASSAGGLWHLCSIISHNEGRHRALPGGAHTHHSSCSLTAPC